MPSSILEKSQEISDKNPNTVEQSAQNELSIVRAKSKELSAIEKKRDDNFLSGLDENKKTALKNECLSNLQKVPFLQLAYFRKKLLSGENFTPQEETWYGQFYVLAKLSSRGLVEISNDQIVSQIKPVLDNSYLKYGNTRAVKNKNPWNLKMRGDGGKKDEKEFAIFSTLEAGWNALTNMVQRWKTGKSRVYQPYFSLFEMAQRYEQRTPLDYAKKLASYLGVRITTQLKDIEVGDLAKAIAFHEDGACYKALVATGIIKDKGIIE